MPDASLICPASNSCPGMVPGVGHCVHTYQKRPMPGGGSVLHKVRALWLFPSGTRVHQQCAQHVLFWFYAGLAMKSWQKFQQSFWSLSYSSSSIKSSLPKTTSSPNEHPTFVVIFNCCDTTEPFQVLLHRTCSPIFAAQVVNNFRQPECFFCKFFFLTRKCCNSLETYSVDIEHKV